MELYRVHFLVGQKHATCRRGRNCKSLKTRVSPWALGLAAKRQTSFDRCWVKRRAGWLVAYSWYWVFRFLDDHVFDRNLCLARCQQLLVRCLLKRKGTAFSFCNRQALGRARRWMACRPRLGYGKCRGRPYWTLARPQSTCSGWDGCSFQQQSSIVGSSFALPPAGFLQMDVRVHHTVHTGLPQSGCSHKALTTTGSHAQSQATEYWRERTTMKPGGYNIKSPCSNDLI